MPIADFRKVTHDESQLYWWWWYLINKANPKKGWTQDTKDWYKFLKEFREKTS
jgi:hypothetical protein